MPAQASQRFTPEGRMGNRKVPLCVYLDGDIERRQVMPAEGLLFG